MLLDPIKSQKVLGHRNRIKFFIGFYKNSSDSLSIFKSNSNREFDFKFAEKKAPNFDNFFHRHYNQSARQMFLLYPLFFLLSYHSLANAQPYYVFLPIETDLRNAVSSSTSTTALSSSSPTSDTTLSFFKTYAIDGQLKKVGKSSGYTEGEESELYSDFESGSSSESESKIYSIFEFSPTVASESNSGSGSASSDIDSTSTESPSITSIALYSNSDAYKWAFFAAMNLDFDSLYSSLVSNYSTSLSAGEYDVITSIESVMNNGSRSWSIYECGALCTVTLNSLYSNAYSEFPDDLQSSVDDDAYSFYTALFPTPSTISSFSESFTTSTSENLSDYLKEDIFKTYYSIALCLGFQDYVHIHDFLFDVYLLTNTADETASSLYKACHPITTADQGAFRSICDNIQTLTSDIPLLEDITSDAELIFSDLILIGDYIWGSTTLHPYVTTPETITDTGIYVSTYYPLEVTYNITEQIQIYSWNTTFSGTMMSPFVSRTVMTSSQLVSSGEVTSNVITTTGHLKADVQKLVNCGVHALIFDYVKDPDNFISYIETHGNESFVLQFVDIVNGSLVDVNIAKYPREFQRVNANFFNFIFKLPLERQDSLLDYMGYCFLQKFTNSPITQGDRTTSTAFEMINWKSGDGSFFKEMFRFGFPQGFVNYISTTLTTTDTNGFNTTTVMLTTTKSFDRYGSSLIWPTSICEECNSESWGASVTQITLTNDAPTTGVSGGPLTPMSLIMES
ncbi:unnamed protein product [Ambrosiozyma monospora]|uniref:Unnamed protein product n=1 Tax=Ambrosiozyma monospora TaxID=43982 RepID=A0A9W6YQ42_AMBMO|nr:unnamed protein product [Ambrosiozyma monospora]